RPVELLKLYFLDDGYKIEPPESFIVEYWDGSRWQAVKNETRQPARPAGRRPNSLLFKNAITTSKFRLTFNHKANCFTGLTELEAWGHAPLPLSAPTER